MYEEFRNCAMEDARCHQNVFGMTNLIQYYDEVLNSKKKTIPEILAKHYVELVNAEDRSKERPGFAKLRAAWRNGALDMKSRKKMDNFVDPSFEKNLSDDELKTSRLSPFAAPTLGDITQLCYLQIPKHNSLHLTLLFARQIRCLLPQNVYIWTQDLHLLKLCVFHDEDF